MVQIFDKPRYFPEFDGLRGLMAWWVVFGHVANRVGVMYERDLPVFWKLLVLTNIPVDLFIALSGFAIFSLLGKSWNGYKPYLIGRIFRLYPVYILALAAGVLWYSYRGDMSGEGALGFVHHVVDYQLIDSISGNFWQHLFAHSLLLHGVLPDQWLYGSGHAFIAPAWSLSLEWQFYLIAPLIFFMLCRAPIAGVLFAISLIAADWFMRKQGVTFSYGAFLPVKIGFFYAGMAAYFCISDRVKLGLACLTVAALHAVCAENYKGSLVSLFLWAGIAFLILTRLPLFALPKKVISQILTSRVLEYFGRMSFVVYIIHVFIIDIVVILISQLDVVVSSRLIAYFCLLIPVVLLVAVVSSVIHYSIESPFMVLGKKFRK